MEGRWFSPGLKFVSDLWQVDGFLQVLSLSVTCGRSMVFSGSSGFLHQMQWPTEKEQELTMVDKALHTKRPSNTSPTGLQNMSFVFLLVMMVVILSTIPD